MLTLLRLETHCDEGTYDPRSALIGGQIYASEGVLGRRTVDMAAP